MLKNLLKESLKEDASAVEAAAAVNFRVGAVSRGCVDTIE